MVAHDSQNRDFTDRNRRERGELRWCGYLRVHWHHTDPDQPAIYLSEVEQGVEVRKVEKYTDGRVDWAGPGGATGDTWLSEGLMPFPDEIESQEDFTSAPIDAADFEREWKMALAYTQTLTEADD